MSDWPLLYTVLFWCAIATVVIALAALVLAIRGNRAIDRINWRIDEETASRNVRVIDSHRRAQGCTLPNCRIHGNAS